LNCFSVLGRGTWRVSGHWLDTFSSSCAVHRFSGWLILSPHFIHSPWCPPAPPFAHSARDCRHFINLLLICIFFAVALSSLFCPVALFQPIWGLMNSPKGSHLPYFPNRLLFTTHPLDVCQTGLVFDEKRWEKALSAWN